MADNFEIAQEFGIPPRDLEKPIQLNHLLSILGIKPQLLVGIVQETTGIPTSTSELPKKFRGLGVSLVKFHAINTSGDETTWNVIAGQTPEHADDLLSPLTYGQLALRDTPADKVLKATEMWVRSSKATEYMLGHITPTASLQNDQYNMHAVGLVRAGEAPAGVPPHRHEHSAGFYVAPG